MNKPLLSICIPTYNRVHYLKECLDSIICQFTDKNVYEQVEIVISDNASQDNTFSLINDYQKEFSNIKYCRNQKFVPIAKNWDNAVLNSTGKYINTIGDDDFYLPNSLAKLLSLLKDSDSDIISVADYRVINNQEPSDFSYTSCVLNISLKKITEDYFSFGQKKFHNKNYCLIPPLLFFRGELAREIKKNYGDFWKEPICDHWAIFSVACVKGYITFWDFPVVAYRIHPANHLFTKYKYQLIKKRSEDFLKTTKTKFDIFPGYSFTNLGYVAMQDIKNNFSYYSKYEMNRHRGLYIHMNNIFYCDLPFLEKIRYLSFSINSIKSVKGKLYLIMKFLTGIVIRFLTFKNVHQ